MNRIKRGNLSDIYREEETEYCEYGHPMKYVGGRWVCPKCEISYRAEYCDEKEL